MPISGPSSYLVTVPLFLNHWADANEVSGTFLLDGAQCEQPVDVGIATLQAFFDDLEMARDQVEVVAMEWALKQAEVLGLRTAVQGHAVKFNRAVRADLGSTKFAEVLPTAPGLNDAREKFMKPIRAVLSLWAKVNTYLATLTPPKPVLQLEGGATLDTVTLQVNALREAMDVAEERDQQATLERADRNVVQETIYPILKVYRLKVLARFAPDSAIVATLPALTEDSEATPEAGTLAGSYHAASNEAQLTGTPSPSPSVVRHQIRACVGAVPSAEDETMRTEFALGMPIALNTNYGLGAPGATVHFRLVAITADGHEKGTDWVTVQRPL